jgi:hypothetical protein
MWSDVVILAGVDSRWSSVGFLAGVDRTWSSVVFLARIDGRGSPGLELTEHGLWCSWLELMEGDLLGWS